MSKATDTREKTREAHAAFVARGETPSARQILRAIDGGSLSTISDELAQIGTRQKTREAYAALVAQGDHPSAGGIAELIGGGNIATIADELGKISSTGPMAPPAIPSVVPATRATPPPAQADMALELASVRESMRQLSETMAGMTAEIREVRLGAADQLRIAYERFEAVQRLALQQVDIARQESRDAKARLATVSLDSETREDAMRGKLQHLREENQRLMGRLEELSKVK